jgi:hypothetical protein
MSVDTPSQFRAFHGEPAIKAHYLARVQAHRLNDEIRHGYYWKDGRGCGVGCTLHSNDHGAYEQELGIPRVLAYLEDGIFEALPAPHDSAWPEAFLLAIPVGADLTRVWPRFFLCLATDAAHGLLRHVQAPAWAQQQAVIEQVIALYRAWVTTGDIPGAAGAAAAAGAVRAARAASAASAAEAAWAAEAASAASAAEAAWAAWAAAWAAACVAAEAAEAARSAAAAAGAAHGDRVGARLWQRDLLLRLLAEAPVVPEEGGAIL